jgi:hypothetical protein
MTNIVLQAHSGWRWIVLALIIITTVKALIGWLGKQKWQTLDTNLLLYSRVAMYIQVVLGLVLYVLRQEWAAGMAFLGGHVIPAVLAVGGVEFGAARARKSTGQKKFMFAFIGFIVALILLYGALATVGGMFG